MRGSERGVTCPLADDSESHANRTRRGRFAACCLVVFLGIIAQFLGPERCFRQCPPLKWSASGESCGHRGEWGSSRQLRARSARGRRGRCVSLRGGRGGGGSLFQVGLWAGTSLHAQPRAGDMQYVPYGPCPLRGLSLEGRDSIMTCLGLQRGVLKGG